MSPCQYDVVDSDFTKKKKKPNNKFSFDKSPKGDVVVDSISNSINLS
jgi:hypothetical protein